MNTQTIFKTPDEIITVDLDFSAFTPYDITQIEATEIIDFYAENTSTELSIVESQISTDKKHIYLRISGGLAERIYVVQVRVKVANGDTFEAVVCVIVEEIL